MRAWFESPVSAIGVAAAVAVAVALAVWTGSYVGKEISGRHADSRLRSVGSAAPTVLNDQLESASARAAGLAASRAVVRAILKRDTAALGRIAARDDVVFEIGGNVVGKPAPAGSPSREVVVYSGTSALGRIVAPVPIDSAFVQRISAASHLRDGDVLYVTNGDHVATESQSTAPVAPALGGLSHVLRKTILATRPPTIVVAGARAWKGVSLPVVGAAGLLTLIAALLAGRMRATRPVAPGRAVRAAVSLVGETLAATHNPRALLSVMLESAIEATSAAGGALYRGEERIDERGGNLATGERLSIDFRDAFDGSTVTMVLSAGEGTFTRDAREAAEWITAQAAIALENAHLHRLVQEQAVTDDLTGLANRRQFLDALSHELARSARTAEPTSLVLCDLDDFKVVNDRYGHPTGDEVLRAVGRVLRESVRELDVPARLGGEEFAVVLPNTTLDGGLRLAERVRQAVAAAAILVGGERIRVTFSIGVATHIPDQSLDQLMQEADRCLYAAKAAGKNTVMGGGSGPEGGPGWRPTSLRRSSS
jgi:diguanylate cyclase (GGDEF)-like protein